MEFAPGYLSIITSQLLVSKREQMRSVWPDQLRHTIKSNLTLPILKSNTEQQFPNAMRGGTLSLLITKANGEATLVVQVRPSGLLGVC